MNHKLSDKTLADFQATNGALPFDSITFEFHNDKLVGCKATKTVEVDVMNADNYDTLEALSKLAIAEHEAMQLAQDLKNVPAGALHGLTDAQVKSIIRKFKQNPDGSPNLAHFFSRICSYGDYAGINWCGMFLGIEKDGYTHQTNRPASDAAH
jgi:hypothetical protein